MHKGWYTTQEDSESGLLKQFDQSPRYSPYPFTHGAAQILPGMEKAIKDLCVGSKVCHAGVTPVSRRCHAGVTPVSRCWCHGCGTLVSSGEGRQGRSEWIERFPKRPEPVATPFLRTSSHLD